MIPRSRRPVFRVPVIVALGLILAACGSAQLPPTGAPATDSPASEPPTMPTASEAVPPASSPRPVVVDSDLDVSDLLAIPILVRDPALDVRAVTVSGTGLVHCGPGVGVARGLLAELGREDIPVACGREDGGPDARPFPEEWRAGADGAYGLALAEPATDNASTDPTDAARVIVDAVAAADAPVTIVALGPLTNVEDALARDSSLAGRLAGVHAMAGAVDALGNVSIDGLGPSDRVEWNAAADPGALQATLASGVPVTLVPLDATDDVPVPADLAAWLQDDHAAAGADLAYELLVRYPQRITDPGGQLWDELAALVLTSPELATWEDHRLAVTVDGPTRGALTRDDAGTSVRVATAADRPAVEAALLEALRRGEPRATPFAIAGEIRVAWDGESCVMTGAPAMAGTYELTFEVAPDAGEAGLGFVVLPPGRTWDDLRTFFADFELSDGVEPPAWVNVVGELNGAPGSGASTVTTIEAGMAGPVCLHGEWPDLRFVMGQSVEVAAD